MAEALTSNVFKTALLFEGGSMRCAYTCAVAAYMLEHDLHFDNVYGVSAGSSNTVNYVSRDANRVVGSFTEFVNLPNIGSVYRQIHRDWGQLMDFLAKSEG